MNEENGKENSLIIYSIFLSSESDISEKKHLNEIAILGGTNKVFEENSFSGLNEAFHKIAINPKFGLKLK